MDAIERQVPQVKRKNSTSWSPPEARLTVVGSVASRSGPREVATACTVGVGEAGRAVAAAEGMTVGASVGGTDVSVDTTGVSATLGAVETTGAQADADKTVTRIRPAMSVVEWVQKAKRDFVLVVLIIVRQTT